MTQINLARLTDTENMCLSIKMVVGDGQTGSVGFGGGHGNPLQYSCLENPHGQSSLEGYSPWGHKSQTQLSD